MPDKRTDTDNRITKITPQTLKPERADAVKKGTAGVKKPEKKPQKTPPTVNGNKLPDGKKNLASVSPEFSGGIRSGE